ncbi:azurin [Oceanisphaera profunda]|uniref:Azurin n=1 Tax=Oceanisphaera profunda TaxID=1416627 RepID=A0A1Y0D4I6_9GAMM|nr:azurin [Oceanisphaera profunda]ART82432.1 azurin [Oceanisphaera profunda]
MKKTHYLAGLVLMSATAAMPAFAADDCTIEINSNDAMQFDQSELSVPASCEEVTLTLHHTGTMPKAAMGHNWVLSTTEDMPAIATDGMGAGADHDYIKADDERVIAHTALIGGGESDTITFSTADLKAGDDYSFFCSFPGHIGIMKGTFSITE